MRNSRCLASLLVLLHLQSQAKAFRRLQRTQKMKGQAISNLRQGKRQSAGSQIRNWPFCSAAASLPAPEQPARGPLNRAQHVKTYELCTSLHKTPKCSSVRLFNVAARRAAQVAPLTMIMSSSSEARRGPALGAEVFLFPLLPVADHLDARTAAKSLASDR
jgi:hypothetical protein